MNKLGDGGTKASASSQCALSSGIWTSYSKVHAAYRTLCEWGNTMNKYTVVIISIMLMVSACGGSTEVRLAPKPVPTQYEGMSIEQLEGVSTTLTYMEILGKEKDKVYSGQKESLPLIGEDAPAKRGTGSNFDPSIVDSIMAHAGTLMFAQGYIQTVYPSAQEGLFTLWFCSSEETAVDFSSRAGTDCVDPLFLLYSLDRGPELKKGNLVQVASIIIGTREYTFRRNISGGDRGRWIVPSVSVVKAKFIE